MTNTYKAHKIYSIINIQDQYESEHPEKKTSTHFTKRIRAFQIKHSKHILQANVQTESYLWSLS